jgi:hypothetical protein
VSLLVVHDFAKDVVELMHVAACEFERVVQGHTKSDVATEAASALFV